MPLKIDKQITILFQRLDSMHRTGSFPPPGCLSKVLHDTLGGTQRIRAGGMYKPIRPQDAVFFASAAVEMWLRGVHSFLISAGVYKISPIWASVCSYYSSHYSVRALAHLLGFFQIRSKRCVAKIEIEAGSVYQCHFNDKAVREHVFYWQVVKESPQFSNNPLLRTNLENSDESVHRVTANYYDHVNHFLQFCPLDKQELKNRISRISKIELTAAPVFDKDQFPEVDKVQLVAYHRIIIFRNFLDNILGSNNRYWNYYRAPSWSSDYLNFQIVPAAELENLRR
jgi:hypothetical protein